MRYNPMLLLTVNNSVGDRKKHVNTEYLVNLFMNPPSVLSKTDRYVIETIQTEACSQEIDMFVKDYNIPKKNVEHILSIDAYARGLKMPDAEVQVLNFLNGGDKEKLEIARKNFAPQIQALERFKPILEHAWSMGVDPSGIKFGGGTALALYYFHHRLSFDLDFFLGDLQYLSLFSPKLWLDDYDQFDERYVEQGKYISVSTKDGVKIDLLVDNSGSGYFLDNSRMLFSFDLYVEKIGDIIAKKVRFRKNDNKARDIFDMAVALQDDPALFDELLKAQKIEVQDLLELKDSLEKLDQEKYLELIEQMSPMQQYQEIVINAPDFLRKTISEKISVNVKHNGLSHRKKP